MKLQFKLIAFSLMCLFSVAGVVFWYKQTSTLAPAVVFKTIKGETVALAELKGKPVLVTFWATDCPACIEEIPHLIDLHQYSSPQGLVIIAVSMYYDPPNHVVTMANSRQLPYAVALDPDAEMANAFGGVQFTPSSFLIDRDGNIILRKLGALDFNDVKARLSKI